jgi:hypothetical protein
MKLENNSFLKKLTKHGVVPFAAVRNYLPELEELKRRELVRKVWNKGRVYYEVTEKALPLLDAFREQLLAEVKKRAFLSPRSKLYSALLGDVRFLDEKNPAANKFLFLGDWQLKRPVVPSQLSLSKYRFYHEQA